VMVTGSYRSKASSDGQLPLASLILASCGHLRTVAERL